MRTIIAGSRRGLVRADVVWAIETALAEGFDLPTCVANGCAPGADTYGAEWARSQGIDVRDFPAPWHDIEGRPHTQIGLHQNGSAYWKLAGPYRNTQMAIWAITGPAPAQPGQLILVQSGKSRGSADMLRTAISKGMRIFHYDTQQGEALIYPDTVPI